MSDVEVKQHSFEKEPERRKVRQERGYPLVSLPKSWADILSKEVFVEKVEGQNPLSWEIRIKPAPKVKEEKKGN